MKAAPNLTMTYLIISVVVEDNKFQSERNLEVWSYQEVSLLDLCISPRSLLEPSSLWLHETH